MKWIYIEFFERKQGIDRLGNKVNAEYIKTGEANARVVPWTYNEIQLYGREVTEKQRKLSIPSIIENPDYVGINGKKYEVKGVEITTRFTILNVEAWGNDKH